MSANLQRTPAINNALFALHRNAHRAADPDASPLVEDLSHYRQIVARGHEATAIVTTLLRLPDNVCRYVFALIAISEGKQEFDASDFAIGKQALDSRDAREWAQWRRTNPDEAMRERSRLEKWAQRARKTFVVWQDGLSDEANEKRKAKSLKPKLPMTPYSLITIAPGGRRGTEPDFIFVSAHYELPLLDVIATTMRAGKRDKRGAALAALAEVRKRETIIERFTNRPRQYGEALLKRNKKTVMTLTRKMFDQIREEAESEGRNPAERLMEFAESLAADVLELAKKPDGAKSHLAKSEVIDAIEDKPEPHGRMRPCFSPESTPPVADLSIPEKKERVDTGGDDENPPPCACSCF